MLCKLHALSNSAYFEAERPASRLKVSKSGSMRKFGLDIHQEKFVVAAQYDHATPRRPSRRFAPAEFWPRRSATLTAGLAPFAGLRLSDKLQGADFEHLHVDRTLYRRKCAFHATAADPTPTGQINFLSLAIACEVCRSSSFSVPQAPTSRAEFRLR
jgi:hypothetical protein